MKQLFQISFCCLFFFGLQISLIAQTTLKTKTVLGEATFEPQANANERMKNYTIKLSGNPIFKLTALVKGVSPNELGAGVYTFKTLDDKFNFRYAVKPAGTDFYVDFIEINSLETMSALEKDGRFNTSVISMQSQKKLLNEDRIVKCSKADLLKVLANDVAALIIPKECMITKGQTAFGACTVKASINKDSYERDRAKAYEKGYKFDLKTEIPNLNDFEILAYDDDVLGKGILEFKFSSVSNTILQKTIYFKSDEKNIERFGVSSDFKGIDYAKKEQTQGIKKIIPTPNTEALLALDLIYDIMKDGLKQKFKAYPNSKKELSLVDGTISIFSDNNQRQTFNDKGQLIFKGDMKIGFAGIQTYNNGVAYIYENGEKLEKTYKNGVVIKEVDLSTGTVLSDGYIDSKSVQEDITSIKKLVNENKNKPKLQTGTLKLRALASGYHDYRGDYTYSSWTKALGRKRRNQSVNKSNIVFVTYEGNVPHGKGKITYPTGSYIDGNFVMGVQHGYSKIYSVYATGKVKNRLTVGSYQYGKKENTFTVTENYTTGEQVVATGKYINDKREGDWIITMKGKTGKFVQKYSNGKLVGKPQPYSGNNTTTNTTKKTTPKTNTNTTAYQKLTFSGTGIFKYDKLPMTDSNIEALKKLGVSHKQEKVDKSSEDLYIYDANGNAIHILFCCRSFGDMKVSSIYLEHKSGTFFNNKIQLPAKLNWSTRESQLKSTGVYWDPTSIKGLYYSRTSSGTVTIHFNNQGKLMKIEI